MFVAWRDLKVARGRFALIALVVTLITVLVTFLAGLTGGLAQQNISAITSIDADRIVFSTPDDRPSYADSAITETQTNAWEDQDGIASVIPLGISAARVAAGGRHETVTLFGGGPGASDTQRPRRGHVELATETAEALGVSRGDEVRIADRSFIVDTARDTSWYSHMPVAHLDLGDWQDLTARPGEPAPFASVLAVSGPDDDLDAADAEAGTVSTGVMASLTALESFTSEIGSLAVMVAMLFGISALVVGAFFTVWSIQRRPDVAVLKALGATDRMLVVDALGQAAIVLVLGVTTGIAVTAVLGIAAGAALPFILSPLTTVLPGLIMTALGLAGAALATRSITRVDPLTALGSNR